MSSKLGIFASIAAIVGALTIASFTASADGNAPCIRKDFKTDLVKQACTSGGQPAAKDAMKKWNKDHNITSCNKCHAKLAPNYELKDDGLDQYQKLGGK
jgi:hypothetical protein